MLPANTFAGWSNDWIWGILLITLSVATHAAGLALIGLSIAKSLGSAIDAPWRVHARFMLFTLVIAIAALLLALLHGLEASGWAAMYVWLGAAPDYRRAIYFSLQMLTTLGADAVQLGDRWKLMGPLEAISGMLLFGLSTAFLLAVMQRVWPFAQTMRGAATPASQVERPDAASPCATPVLPSPPAR
jgi:hypothetical protein